MPKSDLARSAREASKARPDREVFSFEHGGERYWLKRGRATGSNPLHRLAWKLTKLPLLVPVARQKPSEALRHESSKLQRLEKNGIPVAHVLLVTDTYFVMSDSGPSVRSLLRRGRVDDPAALCEELFELLGRLHSLGEYHGGSQIRNFTYRDGVMRFIDFEENFPETIPLETLQFRDLFLLLFSLAKDSYPVDYRALVDLYSRSSGNDWAVPELKAFADRMKRMEKIVSFPPIWNFLDKDSKATYRLIQELKKL